MMHSSRLILIAPALIALFVVLASAQEGTYVLHSCSNDANYTKNSTYAANLKDVLSLISANNLSSSGFFNISVGQNTDKVNAVGLCRGDISLSDCNSCLNFSVSDLFARCPTQREAIAWYNNCMIRYSDQFIFGTLDPIYYRDFSVYNVSRQDQFDQAVSDLLPSLRDQASLGNSTKKFAVGYTNYTNFGRVYALLQCTPDLSGQLCGKCLDFAFNELSDISLKQGGRVFCGSCSLRYEIFQFYASIGDSLLPLPSTPPPSNVQRTKEGSMNTRQIIIITVVATTGVVMFIMGAALFVSARWQRAADKVENTKSLQLDFETVKSGTDNFSEDNKLGQGGFGSVYRGRLADGQLIAVKRLALGSGQGDIEFKNEVLLLTKLQHKNLVRLLGFCLEGQERLLIYEFVPNASLDLFLFDHLRSKDLDWEKRHKIIDGIARGLLYLHEDSRYKIIHRDLKASNVLLDEDMTPKIADFGLARLFPEDQTRAETSKVVGTLGYMAPEYMHGHLSVKSDVYSFGVLLLELVSGRKITQFAVEETREHLLSFAWESWRAGKTPDMIDPALRDCPINEIMRCIHIGLLCVQEGVAVRPSMASVVAFLNGDSLSLPAPTVPAFYQHNTKESEMAMLGDQSPVANSSDQSKRPFGTNDISMSDMFPR